MAQRATNRSTTSDGLPVAMMGRMIAVPNSSISQPAWEKPLLSFWHGSGIAFTAEIQSGRADSFIACRCGQFSTKKQ